mmetsp:Transcript_55115/g.152742  ORF Transcript_55115/g.152742 Transcript_55115/m.152742 type:complete len:454 (-) Transcript_55115:156-1517(-)
MKVAKEQALVRERAADYVKDGREVPGDLMLKYRKTIQQKLDPGGRRASAAARQRSHETAGAVNPVTTAPSGGTVVGAAAAAAQASTPVRQHARPLSPYTGAASPSTPGANSRGLGGSAGAGTGPMLGATATAGHAALEETNGPGLDAASGQCDPAPGPGATSGPDSLVPPGSLEVHGSASPERAGLGADEQAGLAGDGGPDGLSRYCGSQAPHRTPERQRSGPLFSAPGPGSLPARPRARTESPGNRQQQYQWPSYVPPVLPETSGISYAPPIVPDGRGASYAPPAAPEGHGASYAPPMAPEGQGASYVPPGMHESHARSYVPPVAPEFQGGPPERRSASNDWPGVSPYAWAPAGAGAGSSVGGGSGHGSPQHQASAAAGARRGAHEQLPPASTATQLLGAQPNFFSTPPGGSQLAQPSLGTGPLGTGPMGLTGLGGGLGPAGGQQQYAWWQQ